jgi:hypothetical protein
VLIAIYWYECINVIVSNSLGTIEMGPMTAFGVNLTFSPWECHALALVIFVFFILLVRSGCDMGHLCVLSGLGVLYVYGVFH